MCPAAAADAGAGARRSRRICGSRFVGGRQGKEVRGEMKGSHARRKRRLRATPSPWDIEQGTLSVAAALCHLPVHCTGPPRTSATTYTIHDTETSSLDTVDICRRYRPPLSGFFLSIRSHTTVRDYGLRCTHSPHARTHTHKTERDDTYGSDTHACALCCS